MPRVQIVSALVTICPPSALVRSGSARATADVVPLRELPRPTLAECIEPFLSWFATTRGRRPLTVDSYRFDLRSFLDYCAPRGFVHADDLTFRDIEGYLASLQTARGLKPQTASRHLSALKAFWIFMLREGIARTNAPSLAFGPKPTPPRIPPFMTKAPAEHVLNVLAKDVTLMGRRDHALTAVFLLAGLRNSELVALRVQDIDLEGGTLYVSHGKGDRDRYVTLVPTLATILRGYLADVRPQLVGRPVKSLFEQTIRVQDRVEEKRKSPEFYQPPASRPQYLFVAARGGPRQRAGKPLLTRSIWTALERKVSKVAGRHVWPHLLRHSYAVRLRMAGADLVDIKEELGHASVATTEIYARIPAADRQKKITRLLEG
jgi:site-specific recombinase XerD